MQLSDAFRVRSKEIVAFVGAGGKTTAMFRLADERVARGERVVITTTTRLGVTQAVAATGRSPLHYDASPDFPARLRDALDASPSVILVGENVDATKVAGASPALIDELAVLSAVDAIIYEADGARMLPFKAPAAHEPVLADSTTLLVPVIGITAIGAPLDDAHVHRAEIAARLAGARLGEPLTPVMAARVIAHPAGGLKNQPHAARVIALLNQVETEAQLDAARAIARLLLGYKNIGAAAIGAARHANPVRETHRRVAAIVLAAGGGTRMPGRVKQLLPWRGKTLIENALGIVALARAVETRVVLGAHAAEIRAAIRGTPARVVLNRDWETGHASSIRAGLKSFGREIDAAIFINADQPLLTTAMIDSIIQRYYETGASIIAPLYAGKRGSPVLFDRVHFDELMSLRGEEGGREVLAKYREQVQFVEFADARLALDIDTPEDYEKITQ